MSNRIAIGGAGFCGTLIAANLLRRPPPNLTEIVPVLCSAPDIGKRPRRRSCATMPRHSPDTWPSTPR